MAFITSETIEVLTRRKPKMIYIKQLKNVLNNARQNSIAFLVIKFLCIVSIIFTSNILLNKTVFCSDC